MIVAILATACEKKLFVEDISDRKVELLSPGNRAKLQSTQVKFQWNEIKDITAYHFQLSTPRFDSIRLLLFDLDTLTNSLSLNLSPGIYEWRVRASNGRYETPYSTFKLVIDSSTSLTNFQVVLSSPQNNAYTNQQPTFSWESNSEVGNFNFKIVEGTDFDNGPLFTSVVSTSDNSLTLSKNLINGEYTWGVNAEDDNSKSAYTARSLVYDDIAPTLPILTKPADNSSLSSGSVSFEWNQDSDSGSPLSDSLEIYSDSQLSNLYKRFDAVQSGVNDSLPTGSYYWRISRGDHAGNYGGKTSSFQFNVQ